MPNLYSGFLIDLRDIKTGTKVELNKAVVISLFENLLNGNTDSKEDLNRRIYPITNGQYKRGI
jgi:putative protease